MKSILIAISLGLALTACAAEEIDTDDSALGDKTSDLILNKKRYIHVTTHAVSKKERKFTGVINPAESQYYYYTLNIKNGMRAHVTLASCDFRVNPTLFYRHISPALRDVETAGHIAEHLGRFSSEIKTYCDIFYSNDDSRLPHHPSVGDYFSYYNIDSIRGDKKINVFVHSKLRMPFVLHVKGY